MQVGIKHAIAAAIVVATLLIVGFTATLLQDDPVQSRRLDVEAATTCVPLTPERPLPTELREFIANACQQVTATPTGTPEAGGE